ncbi:hypothetical protein [Nodosilinea sp. E11]|uniref:hypothetical protein n=1 Tax=Nodosilinea sp. E11 TaxID=3037479 RepID=UPI002934F9DC|nr:hypothetical protein [Nodosilinea sp. E11]WOD37165.1 hypothetical protein RRF56_01530 [Nodosilinea sp. E11]
MTSGKLGKRNVKSLKSSKGGPTKTTLKAFEDFCSLRTFVRFKMKGRSVGAALLSHKNSYRLVFGFTCRGLHDTLRSEQIFPTVERLESGLKELPRNGTMTVQLSSFATDRDRQTELDELIASAPSPEIKLILLSEKKRAQDLASQGVRKVKTMTIYCTYTIAGDDRAGAEADPIERALASLVSFWEGFKGKGKSVVMRQFEEMFNSAFEEGYMRWESLLAIKMGLEVSPMSAEDLWGKTWDIFNTSQPPNVPNPLTFDGRTITEESTSEYDPKSLLIQGEGGEMTVPDADRAWVRVRGKYVAVMPFVAKPVGFSNMRAQLRYLWDVLCRHQVVDTEIICQIAPANQAIVKTQMQRLIKQSNNAVLGSDSIDVGASIKMQKSVEATAKIIEGAIPVKVATVVMIHRSSRAKLSEACRHMAEGFLLPAKVVREPEVAWQHWLQCHPMLAWEKLLMAPYNRTQTYLSSEAPGLIPLTMTRPVSKQGFELIADEGGSPVKIDFINEHRNIAVFGTTRSGKSVCVSGMLSMFLAKGYPIVCLDYPKPDGTSTFTDYAKFLGNHAAYFDIGRESNNLLELPTLNGLSPEDREERMQDYIAFLESALVTMVLPSTENQQLLEQTVRSLIGRALSKFFVDAAILGRYKAAELAGFGSEAWKNMPTLKDFIDFCSFEKLELEESGSDEIGNAASHIRLQLNYWLKSRIGKAIGRASSFRTDAQLLVFALRNLSNENEAAILSLSAYSAALRRALGSPKSIFFIDESPILFEYKTISQLIGRLCANGAKAGIRVMLSAQDPDTIMKSVSGAKVMQNMGTKLIGRIQTVAVDSFETLLGYPRDVISKNATEAFFPKRTEMYSNWLLDIDGHYLYCRFYPGAVQIAAVANNPDEQELRDLMLVRLRPQGKFKAMAQFAERYVDAIRNGGGIVDLIEQEKALVQREVTHVYPSVECSSRPLSSVN